MWESGLCEGVWVGVVCVRVCVGEWDSGLCEGVCVWLVCVCVCVCVWVDGADI